MHIELNDDRVMVIIIAVLLFVFKMLDVNIWKYDMLRGHHSKNYIRNHYTGLGEWIFFSKSIKEIGIILPILNFLILLSFPCLGVIFIMAVKKMDVKFYIAVSLMVFAVYCFVTDYATIKNYTRLGIGTKGNSVSYGERVLTTIVFTGIICILAYTKARGVLF